MRRRLFILVPLFLLPLALLGDGKVISMRAIPVAPHIPDQRALIHWSNGVERLVIETREIREVPEGVRLIG